MGSTGEPSSNHSINRLLNALAIHADRMQDLEIDESYVPHETIDMLISSPTSHVLFGRRGTGKTHALRHLSQRILDSRDVVAFVDFRTLGSASNIYSREDSPIEQRATSLLTDLVKILHESLVFAAIHDESLEPMFDRLQELLDACTDIRVDGHHSVATVYDSGLETEAEGDTSGSLSVGPTIGVSASSTKRHRRKETRSQARTSTVEGKPVLRVHLGEVSRALSDALKEVPDRRVWVILDEWSSIPLDLQPYLADLIRRLLLSQHNIIVKIAAIEHRTKLFVRTAERELLGLEPAADLGASCSCS